MSEWDEILSGAGVSSPRTSVRLASLVERVQELKRTVIGMPRQPGRTAEVLDTAELRLQQAADLLAEEAVALERYGE